MKIKSKCGELPFEQAHKHWIYKKKKPKKNWKKSPHPWKLLNRKHSWDFRFDCFRVWSFFFIHFSIFLQRLRHIVRVGGLGYSNITDSMWLLVPEIYYVPVSSVSPFLSYGGWGVG